MIGLASERVPGELGVNRSAPPAGAIEILEHENPGAFANTHAGAGPIEGATRRLIHQLQLIESAERQPGERVGATGHHGVGAALPDGVRPASDRDGARRAGGDDASARPFEAEAFGDYVDRRAEEMIPDI